MVDYSEKQLVFGVGSARCGSKSLALLLAGQDHTHITHEQFLACWDQSTSLSRYVFQLMERKARWVGDIAPWYLPYVDHLINGYGAKFICLKRDKEQTVDSFLRQKFDHCSVDPAPGRRPGKALYDTLPKFAGTRRQAAEAYWEYYYEIAGRWGDMYPSHFSIFPTEALNYEKEQLEMMRFIGIPESDFHTVHVDPRYTKYPCRMFREKGTCDGPDSELNVCHQDV